MKIGAADIPRLQLSLIAALLMLAIGTGSVLFSLDRIQAAKIARTAAQTERNDLDAKLRQVRREENEIRWKSALFTELQTRGVIGDEQRLDWVELLMDIREKRRLIGVDYEIGPQRPLDAKLSGRFALFASPMRLQLRLLHEEDLTRLLDDLRQRASALVQVKRCAISRLPRNDTENGLRGLLQAECEIDWITLREVPGK